MAILTQRFVPAKRLFRDLSCLANSFSIALKVPFANNDDSNLIEHRAQIRLHKKIENKTWQLLVHKYFVASLTQRFVPAEGLFRDIFCLANSLSIALKVPFCISLGGIQYTLI